MALSNAHPAIVPVMTGLGVYQPRLRVASEKLDAQYGLSPGWLEAQCGVKSRPLASSKETQEMMGAQAGLAALAQAGCAPEQVDLLLAAAVGRQPIPATAPLIKREIGMTSHDCPAWDVNATCLSALVAMDLASLHISTGRARTVLIVASEIASRALPWFDDPATAGLFGDGAAAIVVQAGDNVSQRKLGPLMMETWAQGYDLCTLEAGGTGLDFHLDRAAFIEGSLFKMDGQGLYKLSAKRAPDFIARVLKQAGWRHQDVDLVVPHQASPHALAHLSRRCGFAPEQIFDRVTTQGNQVAASLPIALHLAAQEGRLQHGMKVLLVGTSAGVSIGAMTMVW
jgi:3-oxoacyl-[acyl-carrier-protein] synthase III